ncbi:MAG TPA: hypothetical protein VIS74_00155, partial [Chthoniobacterales bacterium]
MPPGSIATPLAPPPFRQCLANLFRIAAPALCAALLGSCSAPRLAGGGRMPPIRGALLPPNVHGRLVARTMTPRYLTIHATENLNSGADNHAGYLSNKGKRSSNRRFGRSGWVT